MFNLPDYISDQSDLKRAMDQEICIETGAKNDSKLKIEKQAAIACQKIKELIFQPNGQIVPTFQYGFHFIGHSQGGLILRQTFEDCPQIRGYVATITTNGTPHLGVTSLPDMKKFGFEEKKKTGTLINMFIAPVEGWVKMFRSERSWSFLQYLNSNKNLSVFIEKLTLSATVDYSNLDMFNMVMFRQEHVIIPRSSSAFGIDFDEDSGNWQPFSTSKYYEKLGFNSLHPRGGVTFCFADGTHLQLTPREYQDFHFLYNDECSKPDNVNLNAKQIRELYKKCMRSNRPIAHYAEMKCRVKEILIKI